MQGPLLCRAALSPSLPQGPPLSTSGSQGRKADHTHMMQGHHAMLHPVGRGEFSSRRCRVEAAQHPHGLIVLPCQGNLTRAIGIE